MFNFGQSFLDQLNTGQAQAVQRNELNMRAQALESELASEQLMREQARQNMSFAEELHPLNMGMMQSDINYKDQLTAASEGQEERANEIQPTLIEELESAINANNAMTDFREAQTETEGINQDIARFNLDMLERDQFEVKDGMLEELGIEDGSILTYDQLTSGILALMQKDSYEAQQKAADISADLASLELKARQQLGAQVARVIDSSQQMKEANQPKADQGLKEAGLAFGVDTDQLTRNTWGVLYNMVSQYRTRGALKEAIESGDYNPRDTEFLQDRLKSIPTIPTLYFMDNWDNELDDVRMPTNFGKTAERVAYEDEMQTLKILQGYYGADTSKPFTPFYGGAAMEGVSPIANQLDDLNQFNVLSGGKAPMGLQVPLRNEP